MGIKIDQTDTGVLHPNGANRNNGNQNIKDLKSDQKLVELKNETGNDVVRLTGDAQRAAATEKSINNTPVVDEGRIESIRSAIESGQYSIDAQKVADKILLLEREL